MSVPQPHLVKGLAILKLQDKLNFIAPGGQGAFNGHQRKLRIAGDRSDGADALLPSIAALSLPSAALASNKGSTHKATAFPAKLPKIPQLEEVIDEFYKERGGGGTDVGL